MNPQTIEVIVSPQGDTSVQTKGFAGKSCLDASRFIEQALGATGKFEMTSEYFATETTQEQVRE